MDDSDEVDDTPGMVEIVNTVDQEPSYDDTAERINNSNTVDQEPEYDDIGDNSAEALSEGSDDTSAP